MRTGKNLEVARLLISIHQKNLELRIAIPQLVYFMQGKTIRILTDRQDEFMKDEESYMTVMALTPTPAPMPEFQPIHANTKQGIWLQ